MKKQTLLLLLFISYTLITNGQCKKPVFYQFSDSITCLKKYDLSQDFSFIENYSAVLEYERNNENKTHLSKEDSIKFTGYKRVNAKDYILQQADSQQIIMINEAHDYAYNRIFAMSILEDLYKKGFHTLYMETVSHNDSLLNKRNYPIIGTGYYSAEPFFAEFIRKALEIGYEVLPYEAQDKVTEYIYKGGFCLQHRGWAIEREFKQALNIAKAFQNDKKRKVLVYAGYGHICENQHNMGYYLKLLTDIDPLTIDQERQREKINRDCENEFYRITNPDQSVIYIDSTNTSFVTQYNNIGHQIDIQVYNPRTTYINNRPDWMKLPGRKEYYIEKTSLSDEQYPIMALAYYKNELENSGDLAIPVDIIELKNSKDQKPLYLPQGEYMIRIKNSKGFISKIEIKM